MIRRHATNWLFLAAVAVVMVAPGLASASRPSSQRVPYYRVASISSAPRMCARGNACARPVQHHSTESTAPFAMAGPLDARHSAVAVRRDDGGSRRFPVPIASGRPSRDAGPGFGRGAVVDLAVDDTIPAAFFYEAHAPPGRCPGFAGRPV